MTRRILASSLILTLVVLIVLEVPLGFSFADSQVDELVSQVERDDFALASLVEESLEDLGNGKPAPLDLQKVADAYQKQTGGRVVIVDSTGKALADSAPPEKGERYFRTRPEFQLALGGHVATGTRGSKTLGEHIVYVAVPVASGGKVHGAIRITYPRAEVDARIRANWLRLGLIALVSLGAAAVLGIALARWVRSPLRELQDAATNLGSGDLTARAPVDSGPPEVQALARDFDNMADRLEELVGAQEVFVADASHQLRTPLTALRLRLENLEASVPEVDHSDVEAAIDEAARLSRLVDGLLALARADRRAGPVTAERLDLGALLRERRDAWQALAEEHNVSIRVEGSVTALADADRVSQVIDNLLSNAVDASPDGGTIRLRAGVVHPSTAELHVVDEGEGLDDEERVHAFDRFWRAAHQGGRLGGSGLGLAIVQKLVRADGGQVELRPASPGGVDAVVTYPRG
jgi:signal transduction histidine kinase